MVRALSSSRRSSGPSHCHGADSWCTRLWRAHRAYHTLRHIEACLAWMRDAPLEDDDRIAAEFAIWFHDAVYDTRASDNEERSADLAAMAG